jgi:hypothetical protein
MCILSETSKKKIEDDKRAKEARIDALVAKLKTPKPKKCNYCEYAPCIINVHYDDLMCIRGPKQRAVCGHPSTDCAQEGSIEQTADPVKRHIQAQAAIENGDQTQQHVALRYHCIGRIGGGDLVMVERRGWNK